MCYESTPSTTSIGGGSRTLVFLPSIQKKGQLGLPGAAPDIFCCDSRRWRQRHGLGM